MCDDEEEDPTVVNLQQEREIDWLREARDDELAGPTPDPEHDE